MKPYVVLDKKVGETPLQVLENYKAAHPELKDEPMAYAGRLDPMASGKLLVLISEECKRQEKYHALHKAYRFEVLFGATSDTEDVLGVLSWQPRSENILVDTEQLDSLAKDLAGPIALPYPVFSSKTVAGKPLHTWALEGRLAEITIPTAKTEIFKLLLEEVRQVTAIEVYQQALSKIESLPKVTEPRKALGQDFRREAVRLAWNVWLEHHKGTTVSIATFYCIASSGTYMRSLAKEMGRLLGQDALAFSIDRTSIGRYVKLPFGLGFWQKRF